MAKKAYASCEHCDMAYPVGEFEFIGGISLCPSCESDLQRKSMMTTKSKIPTKKEDKSHPAHYSDMKEEPLEFIHKNKLRFEVGCIIKYVCRYTSKDGLCDLKKAMTYLELLISELEMETK